MTGAVGGPGLGESAPARSQREVLASEGGGWETPRRGNGFPRKRKRVRFQMYNWFHFVWIGSKNGFVWQFDLRVRGEGLGVPRQLGFDRQTGGMTGIAVGLALAMRLGRRGTPMIAGDGHGDIPSGLRDSTGRGSSLKFYGASDGREGRYNCNVAVHSTTRPCQGPCPGRMKMGVALFPPGRRRLTAWRAPASRR